MSIDLTGLPIAAAVPMVADFGGMLTPGLGGPVQRIDRLGTRWKWKVSTPPMRVEPDGRQWAAQLARARVEGALLPISQPDMPVVAFGTPVVASATAAGRLVPLSGLTAGVTIVAGRWLSIVHAGQRYLDQVAAQVIAASDGTATVRLQNLIRVALAANDAVELAVPKIEGWVTGFDSWTLDNKRMTAFEITVEEAG